MDEQERKRLKERFRQMCEDAGYPEGEKPHPWDIDVSKPKREERLQKAADNQEADEE